MPRCHRCQCDFRTRKTLLHHLLAIHSDGAPSSNEAPAVYDLDVLIGRPRQPLFCPHPYCMFMVKDVASTRTLARHFIKKHPGHDLRIRHKCDECGLYVEPEDRSEHIRRHLAYANRPGDSPGECCNISLVAPGDFSPSAGDGLRLSPTPRYHLPSTVLPSSPTADNVQVAPTSQSSTPCFTFSAPNSPAQLGNSGEIICSTPSDDIVLSSSPQGSPVQLSPSSSFTSSPEVPPDVRESPLCVGAAPAMMVAPPSTPPPSSDGLALANVSPASALSVSPCDSPTSRLHLLGPSPPPSAVPTSPPLQHRRRGRSLVRRSGRVRVAARSTRRSALKKLNFTARQPLRGPSRCKHIISGAVPGFGEPEIIWSNGEDVSPVVRESPFDRPSAMPPSPPDPSPSLQPPGSPPPTSLPPPSRRPLPSPPLRASPFHLPSDDLRRRLSRARGLRVSSPVSTSPPTGPVLDGEKKAYLDVKRVQLVNLKRVCGDDFAGGDCRVVRESTPVNRRRVIFKDNLCQASTMRSEDVDVTPPSDYSAPYSESISIPVASLPVSPPPRAVVTLAEEDRLRALEVLRATFPTDDVAPPPRPPSSVACPTSNVAVTFSVTPRLCPGVAPPVDPSKRRNISRTCAAPGPSTSQALASILHKLRPRPQSVSDEDSCFDPRSPAPPSPASSRDSEDGDTAVDVVNLEGLPPRSTCAAVVLPPSRTDPDFHDEDVVAAIPSAQPRPPRPPDVVADPPARPDPPPDDDSDSNDDLDSSQDLLVEPADLVRLNEFRALWIERFNGDSSWDEFSMLCERFAIETRELAQSLSNPMAPKPSAGQSNPPPPPPPRRRPPHGRAFRPFNPVEARRIQGLYRHSRKRAARKLLCDTAVQYTGSVAAAETYFEDVLGEKSCNSNLLCEALRADVPTAEEAENTRDLKNEMSASEVAAKLRSAANTAPGFDKVEYAHLKRIDPSAKILTPMFNRCLQAQNVPLIWKQAVTVLIYKKGDASDISNFRPIALMSCIYKLLMGIIAKRLTRWSIDAGILSPEQKCARPSEGCYEHTYILKSLVGQARRNKKKLSVAWLDIRNAFGSVPHASILNTLRHIGVPAELTSLIMNAYSGAATIFKTPLGDTGAIPIRAGVKQGCPLSPILFNLCIELILRRIKAAAAKLKSGNCIHYGSALSCLAYADDLVIVARSKDALQKLLDAASDAAHIVGFQFRPDKCASLTLTSTKQRATFVVMEDFTIQGNHIPALAQEESYRYLGVPIGLIHNIDDLPSILPQLIRHIELIGASLLAPWQKVDALRTFIQPCLSYVLRAGNPVMQSLDLYKSTLVRTLRDICNLPNRASASYFFSHKRCGGMAFQEPRTECDVMAVAQAVRILSSSDPAVAAMARSELKYIVRRSTQSEPTPELLSIYLSSKPDRRTEKLYYTYSSLWSRVRQACRRLRVSFHYSEAADVTISADGSEHVKSKQVITFLHRLVQSRFGDDLMQLKDQGKVARCLSEDQYANGSTWHCTGLNLRFKDWRFIHRARLNVVPLNANKSRYSNADPVCRHCLQPETLPHVICHCRPHMVQIRDRHNSIVSRLTNAVRYGKITTDRTVAQSNLRLRPDIVVEEGGQVLLIDVTCPFDNDSNALSDAANAKVMKYQPLKEFLVSQGKTCEIYPFVVGALGSWYKQNEILLKKLGMTRRYKSLFRKLCCSDAIQGSNNIYRLHLGCDDSVPGASSPA